MADNKIWIDKNILEWDTSSGGGDILSKQDKDRAYDIWKHAAVLIDTAQNSFNLADGIANLKRSLNQRLKLIEEIYQLKTINFPNKPKGYLELLEVFGIVRPYIMKQLLEIRNDIEHRDSTPPNKMRCSELVDVVWYFLKSTDSFVLVKKSELNFSLLDNVNSSNYWFSIDWNFEDAKSSSFRGWFPEEYISTQKVEEFIEITYEAYHNKEVWVEKISNTELIKKSLIQDRIKTKLPTDLFISGKINLESINVGSVVNMVLTSI
ncbi:hypothetical protein QUF84_02720 [Fictibacillus enclensis]|uniref:hypothetical protein n=1 Tax=Fictibacillus enclensis TaxID=1017270 RepID=UPI0025A08CC4|nr:hypothetical protein [Fictibacillus enclensis]MDM5336150.1 hypothetical protein [Fictibacillus enclensis]